MNQPIALGTRRELLIDDALLQGYEGARFAAHPLTEREVVLAFDTPFDNKGQNYPSVLFDGEKYRLYYSCKFFDESWVYCEDSEASTDMKGQIDVDRTKRRVKRWQVRHVCYAESDDGVHWLKPDLGLYEFAGTKHNNIVFMHENYREYLGDFVVGVDENPDCPSDMRFKAVGEQVTPEHGGVLCGFASEDGIHWRDLGMLTHKGSFDTLNTWFWDANIGAYRLYLRHWERHHPTRGLGESNGGKTALHDEYDEARAIFTCTSPDFLHWTEPEPIQYGPSPSYQMYTNNILPYPRAPHIYMGFPTRYFERTWRRVFDDMPNAKARAGKSAHSLREGTALTDALFMTSRDGFNFKRWDDTPFLPNGIECDGNWTYGDGYLAYRMLETKPEMNLAPNEWSFYAKDPRVNAFRRYTLRLDGFVSLRAGYPGADALTKLISFDGASLELNYRTTVAGSVRVELLDEWRNPFDGFSLEDCDELFGDTVSRVVTWNGRGDLSALRNKPLYMRVRLREAELFAFRFA